MASISAQFNPKIPALINPASYAKQQYSISTFQKPVDWKTLQATELDVKTPMAIDTSKSYAESAMASAMADIEQAELTPLMRWNQILGDLQMLTNLKSREKVNPELSRKVDFWGYLFHFYELAFEGTNALSLAAKQCAYKLNPPRDEHQLENYQFEWNKAFSRRYSGTRSAFITGLKIGYAIDQMIPWKSPPLGETAEARLKRQAAQTAAESRFNELVIACLTNAFLTKLASQKTEAFAAAVSAALAEETGKQVASTQIKLSGGYYRIPPTMYRRPFPVWNLNRNQAPPRSIFAIRR